MFCKKWINFFLHSLAILQMNNWAGTTYLTSSSYFSFVLHTHRHTLSFSLVLVLIFAQILVRIGTSGSFSPSKSSEESRLSCSSGCSPFPRKRFHNRSRRLFLCGFQLLFLHWSMPRSYLRALAEITLNLVLEQPNHELFLCHIVVLQIILDLLK